MAQQPDPSWAPSHHTSLDLNLQGDDFADFLNLDSLDTDFNYPLFGANSAHSQDIDHLQFQPTASTGFDDGPRAFERGVHGTQEYRQSLNYTHAYDLGQGNSNGSAQVTYDHGGGPDRELPDNVFARPVHGAPPTPNSAPMYTKSADYYHYSRQMHQAQPINQNPGLAAFSPFISPELDGCASAVSHTPDYAPPGVYNLSPLTSPAMQPQVSMDPRLSRSQPLTANSSLVGSPNMEKFGNVEQDTSGEDSRPRKTRKKAPPTSSGPSATARSRRPPSSAPKRKASLSNKAKSLNPANVETVNTDCIMPGAHPSGSASNSISPRPLTEVLMAPPPKPASGPASSGSAAQATTFKEDVQGPPATPASMMGMKTQTRQIGSVHEGGNMDDNEQPVDAEEPQGQGMDFLKLPEAATPMSTAKGGSGSMLARQSRKSSSNASAESSSATVLSPSASTTISPKGPVGSSKPEAKAGQGSKKRHSNGSNLVSPALRPKLSPNVKPLLPDGANMDSQTHALLLASRSNYENILSGSHLPGVSYPADLGANLTSKRTSHKIAEQGRRNRINFALQEMQTLLPAKFTANTPAGKELDKSDRSVVSGGAQSPTTPVQSGNSKAATVECAIEYIRHLQEEAQQKDDLISKLREDQDTTDHKD